MSELKPCPFCGGEAEIVALDAWYKNPFVGIGCSKCPAILAEYGEYKRFNTEAEAIAAWNARAERKPTDAVCKFAERYEWRIAELESLVRDMRTVIAVHEGDYGYEAGKHFDKRMHALGIEVD